MNDELERLRREVETLTAERDGATTDLAEQKLLYKDILIRQMLSEWESVTEADLDAARNSGVTLQHFIDRLRDGGTSDA